MKSLGRREFLQGCSLLLVSETLRRMGAQRAHAAGPQADGLKIGLITDLHYADKPAAGSRQYRETPAKLSEAAAAFKQESVAFVVELGDLIDSAPSLETELGYLKTMQQQISSQIPECHFVLGNHCVERLTKQEFLTEVGQEKSYYSFDKSGFHIVILDACFRGDGEPYGRNNSDWKDAFIPPAELHWLKADLAATDKPTIVFVHQRLDVSNHYAPKNAAEVRKILEESGKVAAVFQGHSHKNDHKEINGIHYCTLVAMIEGTGPENNGYSLLELSPSGIIKLTGFRKQKSYDWSTAPK